MNQSSLQQYQLLEVLGTGRYGVVRKAYDPISQRTVAIKEVKIENENEGIPISALREIVFLKGLRNKNIIELIDTIIDPEGKKIYLVLEYMDFDLFRFLSTNPNQNRSQMKVILQENSSRNSPRFVIHPFM